MTDRTRRGWAAKACRRASPGPACWLIVALVLLPAGVARAQHAPASAASKPVAAKPGAEKAAPQKPPDKAVSSSPAAGPQKPPDKAVPSSPAASRGTERAPSIEDVAKRISAVVAEHAARSSGDAASRPASPAIEGGGGPVPTRRAVARPAAPKPASLVTLTWDASLATGSIALGWDPQLDPRRVRSVDLGVRLVWPTRFP